MNILVVGSGAREHAIAWKLAQSPRATAIFVAPGNAGTARIARNLRVKATDVAALLKAAKEHRVDLTVVGPEGPLAGGIVDRFRAEGLAVFGPTQKAAQIEASKVFSKGLMQRAGIPTGFAEVFSTAAAARAHIAEHDPPYVVKADGLAAGKGVTVCRTRDEALRAVHDAMETRVFGAAGDRMLIEE
ncbi:MAG: phosphoribosylamine--glycine ligase, partial [Chloroflexota bacterium]